MVRDLQKELQKKKREANSVLRSPNGPLFSSNSLAKMDRYLSEIRLEMRVLKILNIHLIFVSHRAFKTILETAI